MYCCKKCGKICEIKFGSGSFCSRSCANSRERTLETKEKISKGVRSSDAYQEGRLNSKKGTTKFIIIEKICPTCKKSFEVSTGKLKKFCSSSCAYKSPNMGGYRPGSGKSKSGWYKGFYCGSTWELAFLVWCLDNKISIQRCNEKFNYFFGGKKRTYIPDFKIDDVYIEIKGVNTTQVEEKTKQFPKKLLVLFEEDISHVFDYVKIKYGKNFINLYEGNPHNKKNNSCMMCSNPCERMYCSRTCTMQGNRKKRW